MDLRRVLIRLHEAFAAASIDHALIGGLALAAQGVVRATQDIDFLVDAQASDAVHAVMAAFGYRTLQRSGDAADLIGLKVQSSANDPRRHRADTEDVARLLKRGSVDLARVREYFRLFDREAELDALLEEIRR